MEYAVSLLIYFTDCIVEFYSHEILVEPECCDGSDEYSGLVQCSNVCDAAGKAYRQKMKELADLHAMVCKQSSMGMHILYITCEIYN